MRNSRFNILLLAFLTFFSYCTARTIITLPGTCATRYCATSVPKSKIYKITKVIHKTGPYTVTRWKTVVKPKTTKTVTATKRITSTIYKTIYTVTIVTTIDAGKTTLTSTSTEWSTSWINTLPVTTKTLQSTLTIPAPSGFVAVNDDPDNKDAGHDLELPGPQDRRRDVKPEMKERRNAEPAAAQKKYISAITCTKTLYTKTGTSDLWKTTTKSTGTATKTVSKTETKRITKNITNKGAPTTRETVTKITTVSSIFTVSATTYATSYLSTTTVTAPRATFYAACGFKNWGPKIEHQLWYYAYGGEASPGERTKVVYSNGNEYDCCVECLKYKNGTETCLGSVYHYQGQWGGPDPIDCPTMNWDDCPIIPPDFYSKCELTIAPNNKPASCRAHTYQYEWYFNQAPTVVFNGPSCKRFKYQERGRV